MASTIDCSFNQDSLLQTIRYGPMDYDMFLEHRVNAFPEKTEELKFLLNEFRQLNYHFNKIIEFERYYFIRNNFCISGCCIFKYYCR